MAVNDAMRSTSGRGRLFQCRPPVIGKACWPYGAPNRRLASFSAAARDVFIGRHMTFGDRER